MNQEEIFEIVDQKGHVVGTAPRSECHGNPELIHQVVHVMVTNDSGHLFLQKRSMNKDIQPGKWDTAVGGHMVPGEAPYEAACREMTEELGCPPQQLSFAYQYLWESDVETELVHTFSTIHNGPFQVQTEEIDEGRFWAPIEIHDPANAERLTPNFKQEYVRFSAWQKEQQ